MATIKTCLFICLFMIAGTSSAQCDSQYEYSTQLFPQGSAYYAHVYYQQTKKERQVFGLFFNDTLVKEGQTFPSKEDGAFVTTSVLLFSKDINGNELWQRHYTLKLEHTPNMLQSNMVLLIGEDSLSMIVMIDSGSFLLDEDHSIYSDKTQMVSLKFDASDGSFLGWMPILSDGSRYSGLGFGRWQSVVLKEEIRHYFVPYTEIVVNNHEVIPFNPLEDHVVELVTDWYGTYTSYRTILESSYCTINSATELDGEIYLTGRFTGTIQLKDSSSLFSNNFVNASDVYLAKINSQSGDLRLENITNSIGGEIVLGILPYAQGVGVLLDVKSAEIIIGDTVLQTGVEDCAVVIFDKNLIFQNFIKISFLEKPDFLLMSLFLAQDNLPALYINSDRKYFINGSEKSARNQTISGRTIAHFYLSPEGEVYKQNIFWTNSFAIIEPLWEIDGTVYYRGVQLQSIEGAMIIPWTEKRQRLFLMQKCMKNILQTPEMSPGETSGWYPNPFTNVLYVPEWLQNKQTTVLDMSGKIMYQGVPAQSSISISDWSKGMYLLKIEGHKVQKLIKI